MTSQPTIEEALDKLVIEEDLPPGITNTGKQTAGGQYIYRSIRPKKIAYFTMHDGVIKRYLSKAQCTKLNLTNDDVPG